MHDDSVCLNNIALLSFLLYSINITFIIIIALINN